MPHLVAASIGSRFARRALVLVLGWHALAQGAGVNKLSEETEEGGAAGVEVETFEWAGGTKCAHTSQVILDEGPPDPPSQRFESAAGDVQRTTGSNADSLLDALWDRQRWRNTRFNLTTDNGEHPCFAGFSSMLRDTNRCNGFVRQYPPVGEKVKFLNTGIGVYRDFKLHAVVAGHINVWLEDGATELHADVSLKAARIYSNDFGIDALKPAPGSSSWMEHECKVMGALPFHYTCSNRINILVQQCNVVNAWVRWSDFLRNFPLPANSESPPNFDIVFYMCKELLEGNPNPYSAANTFAHELAHVIQGGFGNSFKTMTEGGATWLEGPLLNLAPRPMVYAWGFRDWNRINAAHFYAQTHALNSRKFYQIHAMFLTYLAQEELLGIAATSALQNYQSFESSHAPWGRMSYDYFLSFMGKPRPTEFSPIRLDVETAHNPFAEALLNYRVALASQCISEASRRPTEPKYLMPLELRDRPFWDCSSYPAFQSATSSSVQRAFQDLHYGGAAVFRLARPRGATISVAADADAQVRTKVLAAGDAQGGAAEVRELMPGESLTLAGDAREVFVVQVNVDPAGETISPKFWRRSNYQCKGLCKGQAWTTAAGGRKKYSPDVISFLRSPLLQMPEEEAVVSFAAMWDMEPEALNSGSVAPGCRSRGYDGVQVRLHVYSDPSSQAPAAGKNPDTMVVLRPAGGYGRGPANQSGLHAFAQPELYSGGASCEFYEGWTGRSSLGDHAAMAFTNQSFSLAPYAGKWVRVEIVFASDGSVAGEGFWVDDIQIRAGGALLFADDADADGKGRMVEHISWKKPEAGAVGRHDGVPVVAELPHGQRPDVWLRKTPATRRAPWSATWEPAPRWVALRGFHGHCLHAEPSGAVRANGGACTDSESFLLFHNRDGSVSLKARNGKYVTAAPGGVLSTDRSEHDHWEKFQLLHNSDGSVSLRSSHGKYLVAEPNGGASAGHESQEDGAKFELIHLAQEHLDEASQRWAALGWSYSAPIRRAKTARLHPGQEACMLLKAPFQGRLSQATLFLLVDKMGVGAISLAVRAPAVPYAALGERVLSPSPGVTDPGIHRFSMHETSPLLQKGQAFLLCAGVGGLTLLPSDDPSKEPFLHLPLTNVSTAGSAGHPGATFLLQVLDQGGLSAGSTSELDPWTGHSFTVRAEFLEEATAAAPASRGFLAKQEPAFLP